MVITKAFNLDINTPWKAPTLYIKQGDADSRKLQATIRRDGVNYTIPGDVAASFRMKKPDGTIVTQDCTISGSVVSVVMDAQCATAPGHAKAEIVLATAGEVVSTFLLAIEVMPAAVTDGDIESHDALGEYRTILEEMLRVKGAPLTANTAADMTDTDRVYVYTGSEVGYVNGSWYYYDGASWVVGGVYNSQAISDSFRDEIADMVKQSAVATESDSVPYLFRPTPNPSAILADEEIVGGTVAHNQLCTGYLAVTATASESGDVVTVTPTGSGNRFVFSGDENSYYIGLLANHVYISSVVLKSDGTHEVKYQNYLAPESTRRTSSSNWTELADIIKPTANVNGRIQMYSVSNTEYYVKKDSYMVTDLTAKFGSQIADYLYTLESGTTGAGVAKLREWGFLSKEYFAYDAGSLKSVNTEGKRVTGFNLFDKSAVSNGYINDGTGNLTPNANAWASDYIGVIPGVSYFIDSDQTSGAWGAWYDADKNFISGIVYYTADRTDAHKTKTAPSNARYMRLTVMYNGSGNIDTFCVSVANPATNHIRKPYRSTTYPTTATDLNGIFKLDANNNLYADGDIYPPSGQIQRRYALVDLGTLNWTTRAYGSNSGFVANGQIDGVAVSGATGKANAICAKYVLVQNGDLGTIGNDKIIAVGAYWGAGCNVYVLDSAYNDAAAFKTAMSGTYLCYELDPASYTTDTADPYTATQIVGKGGTEEWIDNRAVPVPVGHRTVYSIGVPDVPANANAATLKATVSGGKTTLSWS